MYDYTGTLYLINETLYPSTTEEYYLQNLPDSETSITAFAITDIHNTNSGADVTITDEYALSIADSNDTFIEVITTGTINAGTLQIRHKEGATGTWSTAYTPTNPQLISGVSYTFDSSATYSVGANWEFKIWKLEPVTYAPLTNTQLYVDLTNGRVYTLADSDYQRIVAVYNALGTIIHSTTLTRLRNNGVYLMASSAPSSAVIVSEGVVILNGSLYHVDETNCDLRNYISFAGQSEKHTYVGIYYTLSNSTPTLGIIESAITDIGNAISVPAFPSNVYPVGIIEVATDASGSVTAITSDIIFPAQGVSSTVTSINNYSTSFTNFYDTTISQGKAVFICGDNKICVADAANEITANAIGFVDSDVAASSAANVITLGSATCFTDLHPGATYYLGSDGNLLLYKPEHSIVLQAGVAESSQCLFVDFRFISDAGAYAKILVAGGVASTGSIVGNTSIYSSLDDSWQTKTALTTGRCSGNMNWIARSGFLCCGEEIIGTPIATTQEYVNNGWTTRTSATEAKRWASSAALGGEMYIFGGEDGSNPLSSAHKYTPYSGWTVLSSLVEAVYSSGGTSINGLIYNCSGQNASSLQTTMQQYVINSNSWANVTDLPSPARQYLSLTSLENKGYATAGADSTVTTLATHTEYVSNTWISKTNKTMATYKQGCAFGANGVYSTAGMTDSTTFTNDHERYEITDSWITEAYSDSIALQQESEYF